MSQRDLTRLFGDPRELLGRQGARRAYRVRTRIRPAANSTRYMRSNWLAYLQCRVPWRFGARTSRACAARCGARHHRESPGDRRPARLTGLWNSSSPMPMLMMLLEFSATLSPIHAPINSFAAEGRRVLGDRSILNASPVPLQSTGVTACWGR